MKSLFETVHPIDTNQANHFIQNFGMTFYRGTDAEGHVPFRFRDGPRDSFSAVHNQLNTMTQARFGLPLRSLTFTTLSRKESSRYGPPKHVLPVGDDYRIFYNPDYIDLTVQLYLRIDDIENDIINAFRRAVQLHMKDEIREAAEGVLESDTTPEIIKKHFRDPSHQTHEDGAHAIMHELLGVLSKQVEVPNEFVAAVTKLIDNDVRIVAKDIKSYVEGIVEATGTITDVNLATEFMIYAPKGFLVSSQPLIQED